MKYRIVLDNHALAVFEDWPAAIVCFYNKIAAHINEVIEFYEQDAILFTWVKGKGLIHKTSRPQPVQFNPAANEKGAAAAAPQ